MKQTAPLFIGRARLVIPLGLILIASPSILQAEAGVGLDACLPLDVCCLVQGQAHRFCFVSTERSLGAGQVRRSNGTVTPL
jgi:hypothetical protein